MGQPTDGRCARARWIARHLTKIGVTYSGAAEPRVDIAEVAGMLRELADLRELKARNWIPQASAFKRWFS